MYLIDRGQLKYLLKSQTTVYTTGCKMYASFDSVSKRDPPTFVLGPRSKGQVDEEAKWPHDTTTTPPCMYQIIPSHQGTSSPLCTPSNPHESLPPTPLSPHDKETHLLIFPVQPLLHSYRIFIHTRDWVVNLKILVYFYTRFHKQVPINREVTNIFVFSFFLGFLTFVGFTHCHLVVT